MATHAACVFCLLTAVSLNSAVQGTVIATLPGGGQLHVDKDKSASATQDTQLTGIQDHQFSSAAADEHADAAFHAFVQKHKRAYKHGSDEYHRRKSLFQQRLAEVRAQNQKTDRRWMAAPNKFSDMTDAERAMLRGYRKGAHKPPLRGSSLLQMSENSTGMVHDLPDNKDWRHLTVHNNIRDQGACGSCWAIATASVLEAHYEIYSAKTLSAGKTRIFSPQQILECTPNPQECGGKGGCQGATVELGMAWIVKNGVVTEDEQPYTAQDGQCSVQGKPQTADDGEGDQLKQVLMGQSAAPLYRGGAAIGLSSYHTLASNEDAPLAYALANYGPVAVSAAASAWYEYHSGIFDGCPQDAVVDHAIVAYGYGHNGEGNKYWLIRNSWGPEWGEQGFIRIMRHGEKSYCGTDNDPAQGVGCKGGPPTVTVCGMCGILFDSVVPYFVGSPGHPASASSSKAGFSLVRTEAK